MQNELPGEQKWLLAGTKNADHQQFLWSLSEWFQGMVRRRYIHKWLVNGTSLLYSYSTPHLHWNSKSLILWCGQFSVRISCGIHDIILAEFSVKRKFKGTKTCWFFLPLRIRGYHEEGHVTCKTKQQKECIGLLDHSPSTNQLFLLGT